MKPEIIAGKDKHLIRKVTKQNKKAIVKYLVALLFYLVVVTTVDHLI